MTRGARIGLLGGTFDPVHYGHLDVADAARTRLRLDRVALIPSHDPPHRAIDPRASAFHRFALVALAIEGRPEYSVLDVELCREGPSFTIDTLRHLHANGWRPSQLFFIIGSDAFAEIASWKAFPHVLDAAHFAVLTRPGTSLDAALARTPQLSTRLRTEAPDDDSGPTAVIALEAHTRDISSTEIRTRLMAGRAVDDMVPPSVVRHIAKHHLYGSVDHLHG
jgi:nicotinate-nucleotide adenylyltransferase